MSPNPSGLKPRKIQGYGWRRDSIDRRDHHYRPAIVNLPPCVDLRAQCPPVMDQGLLGSCTAHGITEIFRHAMMKQGAKDRLLSRLQLYYDERSLEGTVRSDAGGEIRDGIKCAAATGIALEVLWPYNIDRFAQKPFSNVYKDAGQFKALAYQRVGSPDGSASAAEIKAAIASGHPVVGGFNVFRQFESDQCAKDGIVIMPDASEEPIGGHCVMVCGYGQKPGMFTARNSWGPVWGDKGDFYLPEPFLEQQGSDFWVITKVSAGEVST